MTLNNASYDLDISAIGDGYVIQTPASEQRPGSIVSLMAKANAGSRFVRWHGDINSSHHAINIRMNSSKSITAIFEIQSPEFITTREKTLDRLVKAISSIGSKTQESETAVSKNLPTTEIPNTKEKISSNDLIVIDLENELMWKKEPELAPISYADAMKPINFAGFSDWRIPTKDEMRLITRKSEHVTIEKGFYWTSSKVISSDMLDGYCEIINENGLVRVCDSEKSEPRLLRYVRSYKKEIHENKISSTKDHFIEVKSNHTNLTIKDIDNTSTSKQNFTDNGNGTISDRNTGLVWAKNRRPSTATINTALSINLNFADRTDWRLPDSKELKSITPIDETFFPPPTIGYYISCTKKKSQIANTLDVYELVTSSGMSDYVLENSSKEVYVRPVRYIDSYSIDLKKSGTGSGVIYRRLLNGLKSPNPSINGYIENSTVEIKAIPEKGSSFKCWKGDIESNEATQLLYMNGHKSIIAEFEQLTYSLTIETTGSGEGSITPSTTVTKHPYGSVVALTATAAKGSIFKQWGGDAKGLSHEIRITLDEHKTITAEFVRFFPFTIFTSESGMGTVQCSNLSDELEAGSTVELIAIPDRGHKFVQWSGDVSSTDINCTVTMNGPKSVTVEFEQLTYSLTLQTTGSGEGSITPSSEADQHPHGSSITLRAIAAKGSKFKQWGGGVSGTNIEATFKIKKPTTVTAEFVRMYSISVSIQGKGHVKRSVDASELETGNSITLTAIPADGHEFIQWHGAATGTNPVCTLAMNAPKAVKAEFRQLPTFNLEVTHIGTGRGAVLPDQKEYWKGSVVNLVAQATEGCVFDGWAGDIEGLEIVRQVTLN